METQPPDQSIIAAAVVVDVLETPNTKHQTPNTNPVTASHSRSFIIGAVVVGVLVGLLVYAKAVRLRQGDQDVFFRAGWSIRQGGADLYEMQDDHGWHYHYPPLFAILMVPLADPPANVPASERWGILPLSVRVMVLYLINLACLVGALHLLVGCLRKAAGNGQQENGQTRRTLSLLIWPVIICCPAIGLTLIRGQVDLILLLLLAAFIAALTSGRTFAAGLYLALAICIKVIPAFLLILPLWRRDKRRLAGCTLGLLVGLVLIPAVVLGPDRTLDLYVRQAEVVLRPAMGVGDDGSRATELLDARASVNQSFQMVIHLTMHLGQMQIPARPATWVRGVHWLLVGVLASLVLWRQGRAMVWDGQQLLSITGLLVVLMLVASPVCHLHYFTLAVPLAMAVLARIIDGNLSRLWSIPLFIVPIGYIVFMLPPFAPWRDLGLPMYVTLTLWLAGWLILREPLIRQRLSVSPYRQAA